MRRALARALMLATALGLVSGPASAGIVMYKVLKDGTKVQFEGDQSCDQLFLLDGSKKTPAKDGTYTLENGKTVKVQNGRVQPTNYLPCNFRKAYDPIEHRVDGAKKQEKEHKPF